MKTIIKLFIWLVLSLFMITLLLSIHKGNIYFNGWSDQEKFFYFVVLSFFVFSFLVQILKKP